ncbi:MAG: hypothetical protein M9918_19540 [Anaerolineae bacterium]|nr:hypothetical protein [Anaerolineae bacterium]
MKTYARYDGTTWKAVPVNEGAPLSVPLLLIAVFAAVAIVALSVRWVLGVYAPMLDIVEAR